jgi:predicted KAP-like P-loop ATPase
MWADNETKDDLLGYQVHADLLRDVVLDPKMLPISIGVFGDWGSGKSSLMLLMQESIEKWKTKTEEENKKKSAEQKKNTKILQIMFNSWQF